MLACQPSKGMPSGTDDYFGVLPRRRPRSGPTPAHAPSASVDAPRSTLSYFPSFGLRSSHSNRGATAAATDTAASTPTGSVERTADPIATTAAHSGLPARATTGMATVP